MLKCTCWCYLVFKKRFPNTVKKKSSLHWVYRERSSGQNGRCYLAVSTGNTLICIIRQHSVCCFMLILTFQNLKKSNVLSSTCAWKLLSGCDIFSVTQQYEDIVKIEIRRRLLCHDWPDLGRLMPYILGGIPAVCPIF